MSAEGAADRSERAPPTPSITQRPMDGSDSLQLSKAVAMVRGRVHLRPPSKDLISWIRLIPGAPAAPALSNTYTTPRESVRTVQPVLPKPCWLWGLDAAGVTCFCVHVCPPSREVSTNNGWEAPGMERKPA